MKIYLSVLLVTFVNGKPVLVPKPFLEISPVAILWFAIQDFAVDLKRRVDFEIDAFRLGLQLAFAVPTIMGV